MKRSIFCTVIFLTMFSGRIFTQIQPLPLAEIKTGDRAFGLTVFKGAEPQRFEAEILGILKSGERSYILAMLSGKVFQDFNLDNVAAGMSGSPVYAMDGRVIGAVAMALKFSKGPLAVITPAETMIEFGNISISSTNKLVDARNVLAANGKNATLKPGEMFYFCEVWGDADFCAAGTVTMVDGQVIYTLGHSMDSSGLVALPFWKGEVIVTVPMLDLPIKITRRIGPMLGTIISDESFGSVGKFGIMPNFVPLTIVTESASRKEANYFLAYVKDISSHVKDLIDGKMDEFTPDKDIDMEIRIDPAGLPQIYVWGPLDRKKTGAVLQAVIGEDMDPVIERAKIVLKVADKRKIIKFGDVSVKAEESNSAKPEEKPAENQKSVVSLSLIGDDQEWIRKLSLPIDKKYRGKKLSVASGSAIARKVVTGNFTRAEIVKLLGQISDLNSLYIFYEGGVAAPVNDENLEEILLTLSSDRMRIRDLSTGNIQGNNTDDKWQINSAFKKDTIDIIAKISLPEKNFVVTGEKDFVVPEEKKAEKDKKAEKEKKDTPAPKKHKRFLIF